MIAKPSPDPAASSFSVLEFQASSSWLSYKPAVAGVAPPSLPSCSDNSVLPLSLVHSRSLPLSPSNFGWLWGRSRTVGADYQPAAGVALAHHRASLPLSLSLVWLMGLSREPPFPLSQFSVKERGLAPLLLPFFGCFGQLLNQLKLLVQSRTSCSKLKLIT